MPRYFLEVSYKGTHYSGFQVQQNANTIQAEVEKAMKVLLRKEVVLTGSSRTDAGVHALQNYFHFDIAEAFVETDEITESKLVYKLNAVLPADIAVKRVIPVEDEAHCRFDAVSREYKYYIYQQKNAFLDDRAWYFPYKLDLELMQQAAAAIINYTDFTSFSKRNTQVKTFNCRVQQSQWEFTDSCIYYHVKADRFLRGMVRALTATMLKVGRKRISLEQFKEIIEANDCTQASFAAPARGLFLVAVEYPDRLGI